MNPSTARNEALPRLWLRLAMVNVAIVLAWFAPPQSALAVDPPPDGGYPNGNTAEGENALFSLTAGNNNTAVGFNALANNTGAFNIAVGFTAGFNLTTGHDNIDIGNPGIVGESNTMRLGNAKQTTTYITGIRGVTTPNANAVPVVIDSAGQLGTVS